MTAELAISLKAMGIINTEGKTRVRINIGYMDQEKSTKLKLSVLWRRPLWGDTGDYPESGMFFFNDNSDYREKRYMLIVHCRGSRKFGESHMMRKGCGQERSIITPQY